MAISRIDHGTRTVNRQNIYVQYIIYNVCTYYTHRLVEYCRRKIMYIIISRAEGNIRFRFTGISIDRYSNIVCYCFYNPFPRIYHTLSRVRTRPPPRPVIDFIRISNIPLLLSYTYGCMRYFFFNFRGHYSQTALRVYIITY